MSANDQIIGNVGEEEVMEAGSVDSGDAPASIDTLVVDDAADASSQSGDSDAADEDEVDGGAEGSAVEPADPLDALPPELLHIVVGQLDPIAHHSIRLCSSILRTKVGAPPLMSRDEYSQFQGQLEAHSRHKLNSLYCTSCNTFKQNTPSRATFTDAHAVQNLRRRRTCVDCMIANGHFNKRDIVINKQKHFWCRGCKLVLALDKEEKVVVDAVFTAAFPYRDPGEGQGAKITIGSAGKRWCESCRLVIANLGDSDAVKVKRVYIT